MTDYRGYVTNAGLAFEAAAKQQGWPVQIGEVLIGDGVLPDNDSPKEQTGLINPIKSFPASVWQDPDNPGQYVVECSIPADDHHNGQGYYIREMGAVLTGQGAGTLYSYRRVSGDFKPLITTGEAKSFIYRLRFITSSDAEIQVAVDPSVIMASKDDLERAIAEHKAEEVAHKTTSTQIEFNQQVASGSFRFMSPARLTLDPSAPMGSLVRVLVDHKVDLSTGECVLASADGQIITTPYGRDNEVNIIEAGVELLFVRLGDGWRVSE